MPRIARIIYTGYPHHIVQRGNNRQDVFFSNAEKRVYLELLKKYSKENNCSILAYCLMPNHIHILAVPYQELSLAKTMQKLSLTYTQYINSKYSRTGRLWECRFHSTVVDKDAYLWKVCRYIERNPVRAKIVQSPTEYEWSSAKINTSEAESSFIEPIWKNYIKFDEYLEFLNSQEDEEQIKEIRKSTLKGRPVGTQDFLKQVAQDLNISIYSRRRGRPKKNEER
ncbi:MAG: transposase [Candidatus Omnitrophica bacterium]|nr:transposase [Candidatus Omnitrophota bacterium]